MRTTIYIVMGVVVCQTIGTWLFYGLQCIPIQAYFHPELYPDAKCVATKLSYYLPSAVNVSVDVVIYVLPIFPLWKLQTSKRRRIELIAIFTAGGGAVLVSLLRFIVLYQLSNTTDTTYVFGSVTIVTSIEFAVAMITNNMPGVAAFYQTWRGKTKSSSTGRGTSTGSTHGQRSYELGHLATIGSKPQRSKADAYAASKDDDFFPGTDSEEELNPRHHRDSRTLQKIMEGSGEVRIETNVVVSHGPIPSSSSERGSEKRAGEYFKFG
ncbi:hypothetical protein E8E14_006166 [Neopestalotiopsis sp. 37M]|nr:hypothetical protein E8E14_006166 [Neopestalotiopsis sp. 37M]